MASVIPSASTVAERSSGPAAPSRLQTAPTSCDRITPEFPRAPSSAPRPKAAMAARRSEGAVSPPGAGGTASSIALRADSKVRYMFVPVSPSGTGKTLRASISSRAAPRDSRASSVKRSTVARSKVATASCGSLVATAGPSLCSVASVAGKVRLRSSERKRQASAPVRPRAAHGGMRGRWIGVPVRRSDSLMRLPAGRNLVPDSDLLVLFVET